MLISSACSHLMRASAEVALPGSCSLFVFVVIQVVCPRDVRLKLIIGGLIYLRIGRQNNDLVARVREVPGD